MSVEITGQKAEVSVGEKIKLGINFTVSWGSLKSVEWKIPGIIVKNYVDGQASAKVTKFEEADKKKFNIEFYWVDGGDGRTVEAACVFGKDGKDTNKTVTATFNVKRPKLDKMESETGSVGLTPAASPTHITFGVAKAGIHWKWKISANGAATGQIKDIQLIIADRRQTLDPSGKKQVETLPGMNKPHGKLALDSENPYGSSGHWGARNGGPWPLASGGSVSNKDITDSPGMGLAARRKAVSFNDQFVYFLLYKSDKADSIWIPIGSLPWSCKGAATKDPRGSWSLVAGSAGNSINPSGSQTFNFPEWTIREPDNLSWEDE